MALRISNGMRTQLAGTGGLKSLCNNGFLDLYTGGQPASADYTETGTKLLRILVAGTGGVKFGTAAAGILPKNAETWNGTVAVAGVAGYFRLYGTDGTTGTSATERRIDGNVGVSGSDLVLSNTTLVLGATLTIDTFSLEVPSS